MIDRCLTFIKIIIISLISNAKIKYLEFFEKKYSVFRRSERVGEEDRMSNEQKYYFN